MESDQLILAKTVTAVPALPSTPSGKMQPQILYSRDCDDQGLHPDIFLDRNISRIPKGRRQHPNLTQTTTDNQNGYIQQCRPRRAIPVQESRQGCLALYLPDDEPAFSHASSNKTMNSASHTLQTPQIPPKPSFASPKTSTPAPLAFRQGSASHKSPLSTKTKSSRTRPGYEAAVSRVPTANAATDDVYAQRYQRRSKQSPIALEYDLRVDEWRREAHRKSSMFGQQKPEVEINRKPLAPIRFPLATSSASYYARSHKVSSAFSTVLSTPALARSSTSSAAINASPSASASAFSTRTPTRPPLTGRKPNQPRIQQVGDS